MLRLFAFIKEWVQRKQAKSFKQPQEPKAEVEFETVQPQAHEAAAPKLASKSKLYYINRYTLDLEEAIVDEVFDGGFSVFFYRGSQRCHVKLDDDALNTRLFETKRNAWDAWKLKNPRKTRNTTEVIKSCDNCMLRRAGGCTELFSTPCGDYRAVPYVSKDERDNWPAFGDATYYRMTSDR